MPTSCNEPVESGTDYIPAQAVDEYLPQLDKYRKNNTTTIRLVSDSKFARRCRDSDERDNTGKSVQETLESKFKDLQKRTALLFETELLYPIRIPLDTWRICSESDTLLGLAEMGYRYVEMLVREVKSQKQPTKHLAIANSLRHGPGSAKKQNPSAGIVKRSKSQNGLKKREKRNSPENADRLARRPRAIIKNMDRRVLASIIRPEPIK